MLGGLSHLGSALMQHFRLTHPELDFWVDVRLRKPDGKWLAAADLADERGIGTSQDLREALRGALATLGTHLADDLAESADLTDTHATV